MRSVRVFTLVISAALAAVTAFAMSSSGPSDPRPPGSSLPSATLGQPPTPRQEAERWYGDAYNEIAKADKDVAEGRAKNAEKRFKKALERGEKAVALDSLYHEAFNLIGYAARQLREYERSLAAYRRSLALEPDYAPAREYLGELYVDMGDLDRAREQLAWLEKNAAVEAALILRARLAKATTANGVSAPVPPAAGDTLRMPPATPDR